MERRLLPIGNSKLLPPCGKSSAGCRRTEKVTQALGLHANRSRMRRRPAEAAFGVQCRTPELACAPPVQGRASLEETAMRELPVMSRVLIGLVIAVCVAVVSGLVFLNVEVHPNPVASASAKG